MNRALIASLLLSSLALPVYAADAIEAVVEGECPGRKLREDASVTAASSTPAAPAERAGARAGGEAAATPPRARPRWQSFLPGMIR